MVPTNLLVAKYLNRYLGTCTYAATYHHYLLAILTLPFDEDQQGP